MATIDPKLQAQLGELQRLAQAWQRRRADDLFRRIVNTCSTDVLVLISHDLRKIAATFEKGSRRKLTELLESHLSGSVSRGIAVEPGSPQRLTVSDLQSTYEKMLDNLRDKHIFQWTTFYRDNIGYVFRDAIDRGPLSDQPEEVTQRIELILFRHTKSIFSRGYTFARERGLDVEVATDKSLRGLQQFLYLVMGLLFDQRDYIEQRGCMVAAWDIVSAMLTGIMTGYRDIELDDLSGAAILDGSPVAWLPALGFCRGEDAVRICTREFGKISVESSSICALLLGVDRWIAKSGLRSVMPRLSRVSLGAGRLDITYSFTESSESQDITMSAFYGEPVEYIRDIQEAINLRMVAIVAPLSEVVKDWLESTPKNTIIDSSDVREDITQAEALGETISSTLLAGALVSQNKSEDGQITRNYARDFPLDDPEFRRFFEVERLSVKHVIQELQSRVGAYVWCSVRRSGKTTAASSLSETSNQTLVLFQSMDHRPNAIEVNVLGRALRAALTSGNPIPEDFFQSVVNTCVSAVAPTAPQQKRLVFIIDEYESLFGTLDASSRRDPGLRHLVIQPLISQMLAFSTKNVLLFMGQRPDAHQILLSQNQLSPNIRQHAFPLFAHSSEGVSEFSLLVRRVLTEKMPSAPTFDNALYMETRGHPYLTVNALVDFCDWIIEERIDLTNSALTGAHFERFASIRLIQSRLQRSSYYSLFHGMLAEFLSEQSREQEPWLHAVTHVLRDLAKRHPKKLSCSLASFESLARPSADILGVPPSRLLASAAMANFLSEHGGLVSPAIPLMARLAASIEPRIN
jgi:hypothetical protein